MTTNAERRAVLEVTNAVADAIKELGEVPSGHLYAHLMGMLSLPTYQAILEALGNAGLITVRGHVVRWVGPSTPRGPNPYELS